MLSILYDIIVSEASTMFYHDHMTWVTHHVTSL